MGEWNQIQDSLDFTLDVVNFQLQVELYIAKCAQNGITWKESAHSLKYVQVPNSKK